MPKAPFKVEGSPRSLVPAAIVAALTVLIDEAGSPSAPSPARAELRTLRTRLCRLFKLVDPMDPAGEVDVAQMLAEEDGQAIDDAP